MEGEEDLCVLEIICKVPDKTIFIIILFLLPVSGLPQEVAIPDAISDVAEELAADESDPEAASIFAELLNELADDPVNINSKDESELSRLFFLSTFQVRSLASYTASTGMIVSPYEIANIPGFDRETATMMMPFITLSVKPTPSGAAFFRSTLLTNFSVRSSDIDTSSPGSPFRHLIKYKFISGTLSGGMTAEKDAGEKYFDANYSVPDFLSAHLTYSGTGLVRKFIIGDYGARFGLGTNINTGMRTGLSLTSPVNITARDEIKPYTSTDENNFFRGMAGQFQIKDLKLIVYHSSHKIDAAVSTSGPGMPFFIESLYKTGLHNSASSSSKKDAVNETSSGASFSYRFNNLNAGITYARHILSLPVYTAGNEPSDLFDFNGNMNSIISLYYTGLIKRMILAGEISGTERSDIAFVQSLSLRPADRLTINLLYSSYEPGYKAFHSNGPLSSSSGDNQKGLFGSFSIEAARHLFISAGCDIRRYPWIKYRCSAPSTGTKAEIRIKYVPPERLMAEIVYNKRLTVTDSGEGTAISRQTETTDRTIKCLVRYTLPEGLILTTRADLKIISPSESRGFLVMHDVNYRFRNIPVSAWFRHCIYNTDDWSSRIYTWENDLLYNFSIPALSGRGSRTYLVAGWKIRDGTELRIKYGITSGYNDTKELRELRVQVRSGF